jgi:sigma-B regulation protein RsbU (phosphoserine phosphatase)
VVGGDGRWMAYAADVSGHGVASGTLMAMFKSAARSQLMIRMDPQALLTDLNQVIFELKRSSMFITCCCLSYQSDGGMRFTLAGHLPILQYRAATGAVDELAIRHLPLGMFEGQRYETASVRYERGDVFALLTDGLTEVFDAGDAEFGLARVKTALAASGSRPLGDIFTHLIGEVRRHGPQTDDQSILLVRCL